MDMIQKLTEELEVKKWQVEAAVRLIDEGNTIPFISRYRKEATGSLNDEQLRKLHERLVYLRNLEEKKEQVLSSIEEQGNYDRGIEKSDPGSRDTCRGGRSVSSVSSEEKNTGNDRKRKRPGAFGGSDYPPEAENAALEEAEKYVSEEKGCGLRRRCNCRSKRYHCRINFG